jgi:hypothetical protein
MNGTNLPAGADTNIVGVTTDTLNISNVVFANAGMYSCAITDARGTTVSAPAVLGVKPYLIVAPGPQTIANGSPISVGAVIQAYPPPYLFSWRRGNAVIGVDTNSQSTTNFVTFNSVLTGFTNTTGFISNFYNLRLYVTNLAITTAEAVSNFPAWGPGVNNIFVVADTDGDGIPNYVETNLALLGFNFSSTNAADGLLDFDGDGMSNADEYRAGTEINNSNSVLRVSLTNTLGVAVVSFGAVPNKTYTIQYADAFSNAVPPAAWTRLVDVLSRPTNRTEIFPDPGWTSNRFYRVVTPRAP